MKTKLFCLLFTFLFICFLTQPVTAEEIVINCDGGSNLEILKQTQLEPYGKATGTKMIYDPGANFAKLRAMVKSGNVEWDLAEAWSQDLVIILGREGMLEEIDYSIVGSGLYGVNKDRSL